MSIILPNRTPPNPCAPAYHLQPKRQNASASAQTELDIVTLGCAHQPPWLIADSKNATVRGLEVKSPTPVCPVRTVDSKFLAQTSAWGRRTAPQRPPTLQAARYRSGPISGAAASAQPGPLPAVGPARVRSPRHRRRRLEGPGQEKWAAGSAVAGGKCGADPAQPIGQARPRSAAPAEPPAAPAPRAQCG